MFHYNVKVIIDIPSINQLSDFAWMSSKTSEIYAQVNFECLYWFETTYATQYKLDREFKEVFQVLTGSQAVDSFSKYILRKIKLILIYEEILIKRYEQIDAQNIICRY